MAKYFQIFLVLIFLPSPLYPQYQNIKFDHLTIEQGLSNNRIRCILQDRLGYIWIGTYDGLNRYDGYEFKIYRHDPDDSTSLTSNWITALYEDSAGDLWISTMGGGFNKFDRDKEQFIPFSANVYKRLMWQGQSAITMKQIAEYQYGDRRVLWIGSWVGLLKLDIESQKITHYPHTDRTAPDSHIQALVVDSAGMVWIGSQGDGLHKFDPQTEQFSHYAHDPADKYSLSNNLIFSLCIDHKGILWIATNGGGLNRYDAQKKRFISYEYNPDDPQSVSSNKIMSVYENHSGVLWVGTADQGFNIFDRATETFKRYKYDPNDPSSLSDNMVWHIFEDKTGVLWLGTWGGINRIVPRKNQFIDYKKIPANPNSLPDDYVGAILISNFGDKEILWIGTNKGVAKIESETGKYTHLLHNPSDVNNIPVTALFQDRKGILWIGTHENGLIRFDPQNENFTSYLHDPQNPHSISSNTIYSIYEDKEGILWIGTYNGSLDIFDRQKGYFKHLFNPAVLHIFEDQFDELWVASWPGLRKFDRKKSEFIFYSRGDDAVNWPELNRTNFILEPRHSEENVLWTGTYSGLNHFDRYTGKFINYSVKDGLPSNVINSILEDEQGNLWIGTNNGLSRLNPHTQTFKNFDIHDGLLSGQFSQGACAKSKDGRMFFGSSKGVNAFYPNNITDNKHSPDIVITDFQLFNKSVAIKNNKKKNWDIFQLDKSISVTKEITLSYQHNVITFQFAALDYISPRKNRYAYLMEDLDADWVYTDASRRFATYTNLDPGEYIFKVKGSNNDGIWNEEGTSIKITVLPPWWRTNWAYSFYVLFILCMAYGVWRFQTNRLKMKHEMEMEHFEAEKLREVDHLKSRFLANISHEFRTPLTLIHGPVKQIFSGEFKGNLKETCGIILRYSDRLLNLINQILDLSKLESGRMTLKVSCTDVTQFLRGIVQSFSSLSEHKHITLGFKTELESISGYVDKDKLEKIVINLLSNAFKFTPEDGRVEVDLSLRGDMVSAISTKQSPSFDMDEIASSRLVGIRKDSGSPGSIQISIFNSGAGIPSDQLDKIFDRFYQADYSYQKDSEGTGIGLALTKELVEAHHGEIQVESELNKGTTFTVWLPIEMKHYKPEEFVEDDVGGEQRSPLPIARGGEEKEVETIETTPLKQPAVAPKSAPLLLIVEDNPDVTAYISSFLQDDYHIITAENGKEGLKKAQSKFPDLIISDVMMPVMDGFELCRKLKSDQNTSHIPVILLTAKADMESKIDGLEFGADDYVTKPFEARELHARVKNLIEQRKKLHEKFSRMIEVKPNEITTSSMDEQFLERLLNVFEDHVDESDFSTEDFAREVGMSRSSLHRKLQALTNQPTHEFLRTLRLKRAAQLLQQSAGTITEIAYAVGFNSPSHFSRIFRQQFGQTPSEFAGKNRGSVER